MDLKPEGYQLIKLKENVLDYLADGAKNHLITAFWEYLLYLEVCYKVLEKDKERHKRDPKLYELYGNLNNIYKKSPNVTEGDFSERLLSLSKNLSNAYHKKFKKESEKRLTANEVTALIHSDQLLELQNSLSDYLSTKNEVWVLFDNLDKGWSPNGLATGDVVILRCLIDAAKKVQRSMRKKDLEFNVIVFIRNDVYQLLMENSADFGKDSRASLDWSDPDLLREMVRKRIIKNGISPDLDFNQIWNKICISHYNGEETSQYMIDRSLMRPRNFLKIISAIKGFAVNLQHEKIDAEDIKKGLVVYSQDLIIEADKELTDIEPIAKKFIYQFQEEKSEWKHEDLKVLMELNEIKTGMQDKIIEFLLYFGFLGLKSISEDPVYIFDVGYDLQMLKTKLDKNKPSINFVLNPAFYPALKTKES